MVPWVVVTTTAESRVDFFVTPWSLLSFRLQIDKEAVCPWHPNIST